VILNYFALQMMLGGIISYIYDTLDQAARVLIPHVPADKLNYIDYPDYRRNPLLGPNGMKQMDYIRQASGHLIESLGISPVTMNYLICTCESITARGKIASIPRVIDAASKDRSQSSKALLNRLYPLVLSGDKVFDCEIGMDHNKLFGLSLILNIKPASDPARRPIYNDHYFFQTRMLPALNQWRLRLGPERLPGEASTRAIYRPNCSLGVDR
jgi:hypothetical protein